MKIVLVVEDEEVMIRVLTDNLSAENFGILVARDGEQAIKMLMTHKPDLVLLDLLMPKVNGYNVLGKLKADPDLSKIPVLVLSNLGEFEDINKAMELGADDYIVKSHHSVSEIIEKVKKYLG